METPKITAFVMGSALFAAGLIAPSISSGNTFLLGASAEAERIYFSEDTQSAIFQGFGPALEARLRFWPQLSKGFGVDLSGVYSHHWVSNISVDDERGTHTLYGGAIDFTLSRFFLGFEYLRGRLDVTLKNKSVFSPRYTLFGPRIGLLINVTDRFAVSPRFHYRMGNLFQKTMSGTRGFRIEMFNAGVFFHFSLAGGGS